MVADADEERTLSFVIKIWLEEEASATNSARWRGHITHVPSGQRNYFERLEALISVIRPFLENLGVQFDDEGAA